MFELLKVLGTVLVGLIVLVKLFLTVIVLPIVCGTFVVLGKIILFFARVHILKEENRKFKQAAAMA